MLVPALLASAAWARETGPEPEAGPKPETESPPVSDARAVPIIGYGYEEESFDPPAWRRQQSGHPLLRLAGAASYARLPAEGLGYAGGSLSVGYLGSFSVSPELKRWFFGCVFGVEARGHVLRSLDAGSGAWLFAAGLTIPMSFIAHQSISLERVSVPSLFGLLVPEAGIALRSPQPASFYLRWSAPIAVLIDKNVAVELVPAMSLLYRTPTGAVTPLWQVSLAFSWRDLGRPVILVRSPAPSRIQ